LLEWKQENESTGHHLAFALFDIAVRSADFLPIPAVLMRLLSSPTTSRNFLRRCGQSTLGNFFFTYVFVVVAAIAIIVAGVGTTYSLGERLVTRGFDENAMCPNMSTGLELMGQIRGPRCWIFALNKAIIPAGAIPDESVIVDRDGLVIVTKSVRGGVAISIEHWCYFIYRHQCYCRLNGSAADPKIQTNKESDPQGLAGVADHGPNSRGFSVLTVIVTVVAVLAIATFLLACTFICCLAIGGFGVGVIGAVALPLLIVMLEFLGNAHNPRLRIVARLAL